MKILKGTPLIKRERIAIKKAVSVLKEHFALEKVILFGSKSRGDDEKHSDIDLLLITAQTLHWKEEKAIVEILFDVGIVNAHSRNIDVFSQPKFMIKVGKFGILLIYQ